MDLSNLFNERAFFFLKIPYANVYSVEEYFALPKKEREWYGFYKKPIGLPLERGLCCFGEEKGWKSFYAQIRQLYPIQYFFREWLTTLNNPIVFAYKKLISWPLTDLKNKTRLFVNPVCKRWRKVLPRHKYSDITCLLVESNFALLQDFYHEEVVDGFVDWDSYKLHQTFKNKLAEYVEWVEVERKKLENTLDEKLEESVKNKIFNDKKLDYEATYGEYNDLEKQIKEKETEILKWMIDNREMFWT